MKPVSEMSQAELAAFVQSHLGAKGIDVVLSGGAAVVIYTSGRYVSKDIDLVNRYSAARADVRAGMEELGFREVGRHYEHPEAPYVVEFPPGPLTIGEEPVGRIDEIQTDAGTLRAISPTDCVKDRLAWYYHEGDRQCLEQAVLVSRSHPISADEVRDWSAREGRLAVFEQIRSMFQWKEQG